MTKPTIDPDRWVKGSSIRGIGIWPFVERDQPKLDAECIGKLVVSEQVKRRLMNMIIVVNRGYLRGVDVSF